MPLKEHHSGAPWPCNWKLEIKIKLQSQCGVFRFLFLKKNRHPASSCIYFWWNDQGSLTKHAIQNATVPYVNSTTAGPTSNRVPVQTQMYKGAHSQQTALYRCIPNEQSIEHPEKTESLSTKKKETQQFSLFLKKNAILPNFDQIRANSSCFQLTSPKPSKIQRKSII